MKSYFSNFDYDHPHHRNSGKEKDLVLAFLKKHGVKVKEPEKELTREEVLAGLEQGLREAKLMSEGKLKGKTLSQVLNGK